MKIYRYIKRMIDIVLSGMAIVVLSPLLLVLCMAIKLDTPGPILFTQKRVGIHKSFFQIYKFRTMRIDTPKDVPTHMLENPEQYITKVGKFLRKTSLDELPQFVNVIKGDMSIVGPRPERPYYVDKFKEEIPRYMIKHQVRPGITGWAQVNGYRGDTSIYKRIECDLYYIENWTVLFDIKILFFTVFKGFINKNAY